MSTSPSSRPPSVRGDRPRQAALGLLVLALGCLALAAPFVADKSAPFVLGLLMFGSGALETVYAFAVRDRRVGNSVFVGGGLSVLAGLLLLAQPNLALGGLALLLGLSFLLDGAGKVLAAFRSRGQPGLGATMPDGIINVLLGVLIACQWPVSGVQSLGLYVGLRLLASGWSMLVGSAAPPVLTEAEAAGTHPDAGLGLPPHPELARLRQTLDAEAAARTWIDRYWQATFLLTFFAIHVGRMDADWNLVGLLSPGVAVAGDVLFALVLAWAVVTPTQVAWRALTRPFERRAWRGLLARVDQGQGPGVVYWPVRTWLTGRLRFGMRLSASRRSPTAALQRGLQIGLPLTAVLIALNPIWGFSWYFNTENWATEVWAQWAERRTDTWRTEMVRAVRAQHGGAGDSDADLFRVSPEGVASAADFRFVVIGDTGEGDASQHVLRDRFLLLGQRPEVKFLVIASDVIYPAGSMKDYETKFYLPFKGFPGPVYAVPGNHDWYDALEGFTANFLEPEAARAALRARRAVDHGLTTTTEARIEQLIAEAARLRALYGVRTGGQRAPYFEVQTDRFALLVADTGIARRIDDDQVDWLRAALERSRGKFKMVILGHPLFAGGVYQGTDDEPFAAVHRLLREHAVDVVMAGDTHAFEYYREQYPSGGAERPMYHFVNGGGGAYLSIGTPLGWPEHVPAAEWAFYPRTDAVVAKLDRQTPPWKRPVWFWIKQLGAWPSSPEALAGAFDFNRAPFFQSFVEVRVEGSANVVRLLLHGTNGPLRWRDLQLSGEAMPAGRGKDDAVEFTIPMPRVAN